MINVQGVLKIKMDICLFFFLLENKWLICQKKKRKPLFPGLEFISFFGFCCYFVLVLILGIFRNCFLFELEDSSL